MLKFRISCLCLCLLAAAATPPPSNAAQVTTQPPAVIYSITLHTIHFDCLDRTPCFPDLPTGDLDLTLAAESSAFYASPESIFLRIDSRGRYPRLVIHYNPVSGARQVTQLPAALGETGSVTLAGGYLCQSLRSAKPGAPNLVIFDAQGGLRPLTVPHPVSKLTPTPEGELLVWDPQLVETATGRVLPITRIDPRSGRQTRQELSFPKASGRVQILPYIEGVDADLRHVYAYYLDGETLGLGVFAPHALLPERFTQDRRVVHPERPYAQTATALYRGGEILPRADGALWPEIVSKANLAPLFDLAAVPGLQERYFVILPHGDGFLFASAQAVYRVDLTGQILARYPLPPQWRDRRYYLLH